MSLNLAIERHEGSSDLTVFLGHATGFCKETWRPVVRELRLLGVDATIISWDARARRVTVVGAPCVVVDVR